LIFGRHFDLFSGHLFFPNNMNIFESKSIYRMEKIYSSIFAQFLKIKSQKFAILDCAAILKDFQKLPSTKF
jgi:hypothetical protein